MLRLLPECSDILCTHPMFGPRSACEIDLMQGKNFMYSDIRIRNKERYVGLCGVWYYMLQL
jgi:prephenate dehydrogenase